jgi:hypothetical protein
MSSSAGAIRQGRAFVELFTDDSKLTQGLRKAENAVAKFGHKVSEVGSKLMVAGGALIAPLGLAVHSYTKAGSELQEMSERTGIAVESLSALQYAASQTGASMEQLEKGIHLSQKLLGSSLGAKTFAALGLDIAKLKALSPEEQFLALAEAISRIPGQVDRAAAAMKVFGKGGASLLPFINLGREGIYRLRAEAQKLGLVMSGEDAAAADHLGDSISRVRQQVLRLVGAVGASLAPALEQFGQWLSRTIPQIRQFVEEHRGWIVLAAKAALYTIGLGAALWLVGKAVAFVSGVLALLRVAATVVQTLFANWPALLIAGVVVAVLYVAGAFTELGRIFRQVMGGIGDALAAGDVELALKIMWAGIRVLWTEGVNYLLDFFTSMLTGLLQALAFIGGGIIVGVMYLCQGIHWLWTELWTRVANGWTETWSRLKTGIIAAKQWLHLMSDEEAAAAIKAEIETRTKTISERQHVRADEHAEDRQRVEDAKQAMENRLNNLQHWNDSVVSTHAAEAEQRRQELAALIEEAKAKKEALKVNPEGPASHTLAQPDIAGAQERASAVAGTFDVGALMSLQAGDSKEHLARIAENTQQTTELLQAIQEQNEAGSGGWGA